MIKGKKSAGVFIPEKEMKEPFEVVCSCCCAWVDIDIEPYKEKGKPPMVKITCGECGHDVIYC